MDRYSHYCLFLRVVYISSRSVVVFAMIALGTSRAADLTPGMLDLGVKGPFVSQASPFVVVREPSATLLVGGHLGDHGYLVRLDQNGGLVSAFLPPSGPDGIVECIARLDGGEILIGGRFAYVGSEPRAGVALLKPSGAIEESFVPAATSTNHAQLGLIGGVTSVAISTNREVIVLGNLVIGKERNRATMARMRLDGSLDPTFQAGFSIDALRNSKIIVQEDGKLLVGGSYSAPDEVLSRMFLLRLHRDGEVDSTFKASGFAVGTTGKLNDMALQEDGKLLVAADPKSGWQYPLTLLRLNHDGSLDKSFQVDLGGWSVRSIAFDGSSHILIGGLFNRVDNAYAPTALFRVDRTGDLDPTFDVIEQTGNGINCMAFMSEDRLFIAGSFTDFGNAFRSGIAGIAAGDLAPSFTSIQAPAKSVLGSQLSLAVSAWGTKPLAYRWYHEGVPLDGQTNAVLTVPVVSSASGGIYTVSVSNRAGSITSSPISVKVLTPVHIDVEPENQLVESSSTAIFRVAASGSPPIMYQWYRNGAPLDSETNATLTIARVGESDAGTYRVEASNDLNLDSSRDAILEIISPPVVAGADTERVVEEGTAVSFVTTVTGTGPLKMQWHKDGNPILGETNNSLHFDFTRASDAGGYFLQATSPHGTTKGPILTLTILPTGTPVTIVDGQIVPFSVMQNTQINVTNAASVRVEFRTSFPRALIFYTTDGTRPTLASQPFSFRIFVSNTSTVRAIAFDENFASAESIPVNIAFGTHLLDVTTAGGGRVNTTPTGPWVDHGTAVSAEAVPHDGWVFLGWEGTHPASEREISFTMDGNKTLSAVFGATAATEVQGRGSIQLRPAPGPYRYGTKLVALATPDNDYFFALWGGSVLSITNPVSLVFTNATNPIRARFEPLQADQVSMVGTVNGRGLLRIQPYSNVYSRGSRISLAAFVESEQQFYGWSGAGIAGDARFQTVTLTSNTVITAHFSGGDYDVRLTDTHSPSPGVLRFFISSIARVPGAVQASTDLMHWSPENEVPANTWFEVRQDSTTNVQRYYRFVTVP